ncbi:MAG TPA: WecB/TagA/CpsF family glycosyltransferase [Steroidobacteraceae bacterium]|nr:WecB/TagA/CpsF family glycosyltransferase [Steroidobacteraceae bacterium]
MSPVTPDRDGTPILGCHVDALSWTGTLDLIVKWARRRESRYVCICNVHSVVTARRDPDFQAVLTSADAALPDGMPLAWYLRRHGFKDQQRINGPDLLARLSARAASLGLPVFFIGSTAAILARMTARLRCSQPALDIVGTLSPPFRSLTPRENESIAAEIQRSGARIVFVGLGCPKQERWMAEQRGRIPAVMIGVGAAFDFHAGQQPRAPRWMRDHGLEWLHRLRCEPRRLWRRYLVTNSLFAWYLLRELFAARAWASSVRD